MTDIVPVPAMPEVPLYPALGSANFNMEAYTYGSSMRGVSQWQNAIGQACHTNALVAHERATESTSSSATAVAAKDITVAARDVAVAAKDVAVASSNTASSAALTATAGASTATTQANRAQDIADSLAAGPVASFNGRGGVVNLQSGDVTGALGFTPAAAATTLAGYGITDGQQKYKQKHSAADVNGAPLEVNAEYSLYTAGAYSRPLPANPSIGDSIVLYNLFDTWGNGLFTLTRGNPSHTINNLPEDVLFDSKLAKRVQLTYVWENNWVMSIS